MIIVETGINIKRQSPKVQPLVINTILLISSNHWEAQLNLRSVVTILKT